MNSHIRSHTHEQKEAAAVWTIKHGLYCHPNISVRVMHEGALTAILPQNITYPDPTTVVVEFSSPRAGNARLA